MTSAGLVPYLQGWNTFAFAAATAVATESIGMLWRHYKKSDLINTVETDCLRQAKIVNNTLTQAALTTQQYFEQLPSEIQKRFNPLEASYEHPEGVVAFSTLCVAEVKLSNKLMEGCNIDKKDWVKAADKSLDATAQCLKDLAAEQNDKADVKKQLAAQKKAYQDLQKIKNNCYLV